MLGLTAGGYRERSGEWSEDWRRWCAECRAGEEGVWMRWLGHCWFFIGRGEDGWHGMGVGLVLTKSSGRSCFLFPEKALLVACLSVISPPWGLGLYTPLRKRNFSEIFSWRGDDVVGLVKNTRVDRLCVLNHGIGNTLR